MNATPSQTVPCFHLRFEGSAQQVGYAQGELLAGIPGWVDFVRSGAGKLTPAQITETLRLFERFCPSVNAEIAGMAAAAGIPVEEVIYYASSYLRAPVSCSHVALLPGKTTDGHVLVGRNYDFSPEMDDLRLVTKRLDGGYRHLGFTVMLFGLCDGMNEHGLAVTMSAGGSPVGPVRAAIQDGFQFWVLIRALLERCRNVDEALALIAEMPLAGNPNLLLADRRGQAALVEIYGADYAVKRIDPHSAEQALTSTNHYQLPEMQRFQSGCMTHTVTRLAALQRFAAQEQPVSRADLQRLLATEYPAGLCCHFYAEYFGTLHSLVFDVTSGQADICFGSPAANPYHTLTLDSHPPAQPYSACLPWEQAPADYWQVA